MDRKNGNVKENNLPTMTKKETRRFTFSAVLAGLVVGIIFILIIFLFILFCLYVWF